MSPNSRHRAPGRIPTHGCCQVEGRLVEQTQRIEHRTGTLLHTGCRYAGHRLDQTVHRSHDVRRGDAVQLEQLLRLATARDFANRQSCDDDAVLGHGGADRIAQTADAVMIFDRDDSVAGLHTGGDQRALIDRLHRVGVDDADVDPSACRCSCASSASNTVTPAATTVATSSVACWRKTFEPPIVKLSVG